jgi:hypothetical protein
VGKLVTGKNGARVESLRKLEICRLLIRSMPCTEEEDKTKGIRSLDASFTQEKTSSSSCTREPGAASTDSNAGAGSQDKTRSNMTNRFKYSSLEKGKKAQAGGLRNKIFCCPK